MSECLQLFLKAAWFTICRKQTATRHECMSQTHRVAILIHNDATSTCRVQEKMDGLSVSDLQIIQITFLVQRRKRRKNGRKRRLWVCPVFQKCQRQGAFHNLVKEMRLEDPTSHFSYFRMSKEFWGGDSFRSRLATSTQKLMSGSCSDVALLIMFA